MDPRFLAHNSHWLSPHDFTKRDPQLVYLSSLKYLYRWPLIDQFPTKEPGIYTLSGGRQIGKTTLLKQWMALLLQKRINPKAIAFFSGELIDDAHTLIHLLQHQLEEMPQKGLNYLIIDEVTYINEWDKAIKYAADAGLIRNTFLVITGSDLGFLKAARMRFPGRRGKASKHDFHLNPLSFKEYVLLRGNIASLEHKIQALKFSRSEMSKLYKRFEEYLIHGGYLTAINDLAMRKKISESTLTTYSDWIRGDILKRNKQERYLKEILKAIIHRYTSQLTWNTLSADLSIDHPKTVLDYVTVLESMDALFVQSALVENKLEAAPKKARKITFTDPFIFHAVQAWLNPNVDPFENQILPLVQDSKKCSLLIEGCVSNHFKRHYPTYYIKGEGEVDIAFVQNGQFFPIEVKWTEQPKRSELKQILKYKNGVVLTRQMQAAKIDHLPLIPIPLALLAI